MPEVLYCMHSAWKCSDAAPTGPSRCRCKVFCSNDFHEWKDFPHLKICHLGVTLRNHTQLLLVQELIKLCLQKGLRTHLSRFFQTFSNPTHGSLHEMYLFGFHNMDSYDSCSPFHSPQQTGPLRRSLVKGNLQIPQFLDILGSFWVFGLREGASLSNPPENS